MALICHRLVVQIQEIESDEENLRLGVQIQEIESDEENGGGKSEDVMDVSSLEASSDHDNESSGEYDYGDPLVTDVVRASC